jgi:hypothetical protein
MASELRNLDSDRAATLALLCKVIVPGSERVGPVIYIDALLSRMAAGEREAVLGSIDELADAAAGGEPALREHALTPAFLQIRALAIEAFYSDFVASGAPGPSAYAEIDFHSPLAMRIAKDWSFMGIGA